MPKLYKTHGRYCLLRAFPTNCPKCGEKVFYWECKHGSKVFFNYPPYGKLIRHICQSYLKKNIKEKFKIIVKTPKILPENTFITCPICAKSFKNENALEQHIKSLRNIDEMHYKYYNNEIIFDELRNESNRRQNNYFPKFGRINIRNKKNN
ncbi:MAG: C2H2-type zinc finger protein [Promethearchaeota archaeon]